MKVSVVGLGRLGFPMAACFASNGHTVIGVDIDYQKVDAVNRRACALQESRLAETLVASGDRLSATDDCDYAIRNSDLTFIVVPTPSEEDGTFSTAYVEAACEEIAKELGRKRTFHVVTVVSTVLPGAMEQVVKPLLEEVSRRRCGTDFGLAYTPEFIALGTVIRDFTRPDVVVIGESESRTGDVLFDFYRTICGQETPVVRTTFYNAELAKIALNVFVTVKISFANMIAEFCERMPDGDADVVSAVLGFDSRIGRKYLTAGLAYGGPCFPRDNEAFAAVGRLLGCSPRLSDAAKQTNKEQAARVVQLLKRKLGAIADKEVAILGLTYKPDTDFVAPSASMEIAEALLREGARIRVYDPAGMENARKVLGEEVRYANSAKDCVKDAELCIVATPWDEFKSLQPQDFTSNGKEPVLLDCWRILGRSEFSSKLRYLAIGLSESPSSG